MSQIEKNAARALLQNAIKNNINIFQLASDLTKLTGSQVSIYTAGVLKRWEQQGNEVFWNGTPDEINAAFAADYPR